MKLKNISFNLSLTKDQTLRLKAIGILLIVLHNFSRWVYPSTGENEFYFDQSALVTTIDLAKSSLWMFFKAFFNFFGHYGVQLFVYLSGYGLVLSYLNKKPTWLKFVFYRFQKLYPALVAAIIGYLIYYVFILYIFPGWEILPNILSYLTFTSTLVPGMGQTLVGPWWFFSTIFQLYLIFPILIKVYIRYGSRWLLLIGFLAWTLTLVHPFINSPYKVNLLETFIGQMPVFILGIWFGTDNNKKIQWYIPLILLVIFCLGCYYKLFWPFTSLSITILLILIGKAILNLTEKIKPLSYFLIFTGTISVYMFAFNGFMRWPFVYIINLNKNMFWVKLSTFLLFLLLLFTTSWVFTKAEELWRQKLILQKSMLSKIIYTTGLFSLSVILIVLGYIMPIRQLNTSAPVKLLGDLEELKDTTRQDIAYYKTESGEKVICLNPEVQYSYFEKFKISPDKQKGSTRLIISSQVLFDSIPQDFWLVQENFFDNIKIKRKSKDLVINNDTRNLWQPFELEVNLRDPLVLRSEHFQFYFFAKTNGKVYIDRVQVKLK